MTARRCERLGQAFDEEKAMKLALGSFVHCAEFIILWNLFSKEKRDMGSRSIALITALAVASLLSACGGAPTPNSTANTANSNKPVGANTKPVETVINNAPTLTPVYKAYCAAVVKRDEAAIKKFYTADTLKKYEEDMKAEKIKTMAEYLEMDKISNELCEVSNEEITGDTAVAKIRTNGYPTGLAVLWMKENGEWKMSNKRPPGSIQ